MSVLVQLAADAMAAKRRELINQPLERTWPDLARAAIDALPGLYTVAAWQPIETAPKDGTRVLLFTTTAGDDKLTEYLEAGGDDEIPLERVQVGFWDEGNEHEDHIWDRPAQWHLETIGNPTHWMPLPPAPEAQP